MPIVPVNRGSRPAAEPAAEANEDAAVGYCRPPKHSQFKPGQSGNPKGRPKSAKGLNTIVRAAMLQKVRIRTADGERSVSRAEALVLKTIELASKDNLRATERLLGWYQQAVPDTMPRDAGPPRAEDLTATDDAILAALTRSIGAEAAAPDPAIRKRQRHAQG